MNRNNIIIAATMLLLIGGCDKQDSTARQPPASTPMSSPAPVVVAASPNPIDPGAEFPKFAAIFVNELWMQSIGKPEPKKDFWLHMYKKESAGIDVKHTDSLINPIVGTIQIEQAFTGARFDTNGESQAMVSGRGTDTFNFALAGGEWKYINGHSSGSMSKQDVRDVSLANRQGTSSARLDEDLSNDPRILKIVQTAMEKYKSATGKQATQK